MYVCVYLLYIYLSVVCVCRDERKCLQVAVSYVRFPGAWLALRVSHQAQKLKIELRFSARIILAHDHWTISSSPSDAFSLSIFIYILLNFLGGQTFGCVFVSCSMSKRETTVDHRGRPY